MSISRRTRLSFSTGSAILSGTGERFGGETSRFSYHVTGAANLAHEMGRTWKAQLAYRRGVDFHEGFRAPFLTDGVSAAIGGLVSTRVRFSAGADYVFGKVSVTAPTGKFSSVSANTGLEFGLSRMLALFARYVYYKYDFDSQIALDPRLARALDRQGVRVGLQASLPVIR